MGCPECGFGHGSHLTSCRFSATRVAMTEQELQKTGETLQLALGGLYIARQSEVALQKRLDECRESLAAVDKALGAKRFLELRLPYEKRDEVAARVCEELETLKGKLEALEEIAKTAGAYIDDLDDLSPDSEISRSALRAAVHRKRIRDRERMPRVQA